jgi:hypothetical protein
VVVVHVCMYVCVCVCVQGELQPSTPNVSSVSHQETGTPISEGQGPCHQVVPCKLTHKTPPNALDVMRGRMFPKVTGWGGVPHTAAHHSHTRKSLTCARAGNPTAPPRKRGVQCSSSMMDEMHSMLEIAAYLFNQDPDHTSKLQAEGSSTRV